MSVLQVYLSWANSLLSEVNSSVHSVSGVQEGKALCQMIDILAPEATLMAKVQASGVTTQRAYIQMALEHMKTHGVKLAFSAQDIIDGDIKSLLDVIWHVILNYGIHFIGESSNQRGMGTGKRNLMDWCQGELDVSFDPRNSLAFSLCSENRFIKLLQKFAGRHIEETEDKVSLVSRLLQDIEERYGIKQSIISPVDIIEGTVDDHTLMIYLSLLRRREQMRSVSEEPMSRRHQTDLVTLTQQLHRQQQKHLQQHHRASSVESSLTQLSSLNAGHTALQSGSQESVESDWLSSDTNCLMSGRERSLGERSNFLLTEAEQVLEQAISEKVKEHLPVSERYEDKYTDASLGHSGKEIESILDVSSGAFDEGYITNRKDTPWATTRPGKDKDKVDSAVIGKSDKHTLDSCLTKSCEVETSNPGSRSEKSVKIRLKRPKDYCLQWEEMIGRLSQGPPDPPDVSDTSPRSPRQILQGMEEVHSSRSRSAYSESDIYGGHYTPVMRRTDYFERIPGPLTCTGHLDELTCSPRSTSLPLSSQSIRGRMRQRKGSPSPGDKGKRKKTNDSQVRQAEIPKMETLPCAQDYQYDKQRGTTALSINGVNGQQEITLSKLDGSSTFMERLKELKRSGRAQRVILPDLGPNAPVLMIPGQGEEVLLLFDALRQARLEVNLNMAKASGTTDDTSEVPDDTGSADRSLPLQDENTTEVKRPSSADKTGRNARTKATMQLEVTGATGRLHTATVHRRPFSKPSKLHVTSLQSSKNGRRTKSLTEGSSGTNFTSASLRFHSLSPARKPVSSGAELLNIVAGDINTVAFRDISMSRSDVLLNSPGRNFSRDSSRSFHRNFHSGKITLSEAASGSPFRGQDSHKSFRNISPSTWKPARDSPEQHPRLELQEDLASSRPRVGGLGRVPRREAWERQRQRIFPVGTDFNAQTKFIELLCKEIEELKHKIEVMEDFKMKSSPERASPLQETQSMPTGQTGTFYTSEIQTTDKHMLLAPKEESASGMNPKAHHSLKPGESSKSTFSPSQSSRLIYSSTSPRRQYTCTSPTADRAFTCQSPSPETTRSDHFSPSQRPGGDSSLVLHPLSADRGSAESAEDTRMSECRESPGKSRGISLGYKSPIRSVTQEIWGKDLTSVEGLDPDRRDKYKRLISQSTLMEEDVIELKQCLASAVVENDILQAKLNNARHEIQDKLSKTNEVLDDCRRHLARSQAENMELRTTLEREKDRAETNEACHRDLQQIIQQVRSDNDELEQELHRTLSILDHSKPSIDTLKHQNAQLQERALAIQNENSSLKREMDDLRKSHFRSLNTIRELRSLLDEVREERNDLQQKVSSVERLQNESKVKSIIMHYSTPEKGSEDEAEHEYSSSGVSSCSERCHCTFHCCHSEDLTSTATTATTGKDVTRVSSTTTRASSQGEGLSYSYEDLTPTVPSTYREIYPHRKPRYQALSEEMYSSAEGQDSPISFIDSPDLQQYPTKLDWVVLSKEYNDEEDYSKPSPRHTSPILKPTPYRPYVQDKSSYPAFSDRSQEQSEETQSHSRGRSPGSLRQSYSNSSSPVRVTPSDFLNRSFDMDMFELRKRRSASCSPERYQDGRRGILKKGQARDRSSSPRSGVKSSSHYSRLSPENNDTVRRLLFNRTQAGQIARDLQPEFDKEEFILDGLRSKHRTKSLFELHLEESLLLSEEQRRYANELIKKYTGLTL